MAGLEWIIDAHGCDPSALRDRKCLQALFTRLIDELNLTPVAAPVWHAFPAPGGVTGFVMLAESHLACHTFPEFGSMCLNVFCCRPRPEWDARLMLSTLLGAREVEVRCMRRAYAPVLEPALETDGRT